MRRISLWLPAAILCLFCYSCTPEEAFELSDIPSDSTETSVPTVEENIITIKCGNEETKTSISDNYNVLWDSGDRISLMYSGAGDLELSLLTYDALSKMSNNTSKTVMITSTSYDGQKWGSSGNTWSCVAVGAEAAYTDKGTSITTAQATANQTRLTSEMKELACGEDGEKYLFTITKTSSGYTIQNHDGYYIYGSGTSLSLSNTQSTALTLNQPTKTSATSTIVTQNTSSRTIANASLVRFKNGSYYLFNGSSGPTFSTESGGWSFFYLYEVTGESGRKNNSFTLTSGAGEAKAEFTGSKDEGYEDYVALYPYSDDNSFDGETVSFTLPATQTFRTGSFASGANVAAGLLDDENHVSFKNLLGALKLTLSGSHTITSISLKDNGGTLLSGKAAIALSDLEAGDYGFSLSNGSSTLTLDCGDGVILSKDSPTDFYFAVPPGALSSGFTVTFTTSAGELSRIASADNTIHRSKVREMPEMGDDALRVSYSIENDVVADYMANVNYTDAQFDAGTSLWSSGNYTSKAQSSSVAPNTDQPNPITITWSASGSGTATASLYKDEACTKLVQSGTAAISDGSYSFHSLLPDMTYHYRVESGDSGVIATGSFCTTGQLRMIKLDGGWNVRDMGGWTGLGGKRFPYENVYRGGYLEYCSDAEKLFLYNLGIRSELELRGNTADKDAGISKYHNIGTGSYAVDETMIWNGNNDVVYYQNCSDYAEDDIMLTTTGHNEDAYVMNMAFVIDILANQHKPLYFHCKSGADRTGMTAFFIEALLGFTKSEIIKDYELTSFNADDQGLGGRVWSSTCRPANAYKKLMAMEVPAGVETLQQRVYYYLNNYWDRKINASDLDKFIMYMLGMTEEEYAPYRPKYSGKYENASNTLASIYAK